VGLVLRGLLPDILTGKAPARATWAKEINGPAKFFLAAIEPTRLFWTLMASRRALASRKRQSGL
jgi:hypothetical protein